MPEQPPPSHGQTDARGSSARSTRGGLLLDRDGVIIEEVNYLAHPDQVQLLPGAAEAIGQANRRGVPVVVITNQAGVAHGYFPESRIAEVHRRLDELLAAQNARVDAYFYCPHHPQGKAAEYRMVCDCRKPSPGLIHQAAAAFDLDLAESLLVGDKLSDLAAGKAAGCRLALVKTGYGASHCVLPDLLALGAVLVADDLPSAVAKWLG